VPAGGSRLVQGFNPRPRTGSDAANEGWTRDLTELQSTPPHGERLTTPSTRKLWTKLQSTPPHGERPDSGLLFLSEARLQSTPPHGERRGHQIRFRPGGAASIHAPARGATRVGWGNAGDDGASIHAPARGATVAGGAWLSRACASIHAPARGATWCWHLSSQVGRASIHAPARGATWRKCWESRRWQLQSTPPHGERPLP